MMKKITLLAASLMMSVFTFAQTELIQDQDFSDGLATVVSCNSFTGPLTGTESWWRCGTATIVGTELEYPTDKGPNIRQRISVEADSYYEVSFDIRSDVSGEADGQGFVASFRDETDVATSLEACFNIGTPENLITNFNVPSADFTTSAVTHKFGFYSSADQNVIINLIRPKETATKTAQVVYLSNVSVKKNNTLTVQDLQKFNFSYAPNPSKDLVRLTAASTIENVEIFNLLGQKVISEDLDSNNETVNISNLVNGIYVMNVTIDGAKGSFKIIKE